MSDAVDVMRTLTMDQLRDAESIIFGDDNAKERASNRLIDSSREGQLLVDLNTTDLQALSLQDFVDLKVETMKKLGFTEKEIMKSQQNAKSTTYQFVTMEGARMINAAVAEATGKNVRIQDMSASEKIALFEDSQSGVKEAIVNAMTADFQYSLRLMEDLGMENPENFFKGYDDAKQRYLATLSSEFPGVQVDQFAPVLDVLVAATSTARPAYPNMLMSMNMLHTCVANFKQNYTPGQPFDFIPKSLIKDLRSGEGKYKEVNMGVEGYTMKTIGATLEVVNSLFNKYLDPSGKFNADGFMSEMSQRYEKNGVPTDLPVMSDAMSSRKGAGAPKTGSFAVTMMGALGANFLTQDIHVMDYLGVFTGELGIPRGGTILVDRPEMISLIQKHQKVKKGTQTKTLVSMLTDMSNNSDIPSKDRKAAKDMLISMFNPMSGRQMDPESKKLRYKVVQAFVQDHNRRNLRQPIHDCSGRSDAVCF